MRGESVSLLRAGEAKSQKNRENHFAKRNETFRMLGNRGRFPGGKGALTKA
jgi:hypothetical protein